MNAEQQKALLQTCIDLAADGSTQLAELGGRADTERYTDAARFANEQERLFRHQPLAVALASRLDAPDSFVTVDTPLGNLMLLRDERGTAQAFHNACRHRGTRLVDAEQGCAERFRCPYHAWTYDRDGTLVGVPHGDTAFPGLDRDANGLVPVATVLRHGLVWVNARPGPLDHHLRGLADELDWLGIDTLVEHAVSRRRWQANWKLIAEGGLEAYHFRQAHRDTIAPHFFDNLSLWAQFGSHFRTVLPKRSIETLPGQPDAEWRIRDHCHLTYALFPTTTLLVQADHLAWIQALPVSTDATEVRVATLVPAAEADRREHWDRNHAITCATLDEDFALAESIQSGLRSGANAALQFGRNEGALTALNAAIDGLLAD